MKLIEFYPETKANLDYLQKERSAAQENSLLISSEEKEQRAENTSRMVRKALLNGSARIG